MASDIRTNIKITASADPSLEAAKKKIKDAFSANPVRQFNQAIKQVNTSLASIAKSSKAVQGSFKGMTSEIRGLSSELKKVAQQMEKMGQSSRSSGRRAMFGGAVGGYFGARAGRAAGGVLSGGAGGLGQALSAIPGVGRAAAGALNSAMSAAQQNVSFYQQRAELTPFTGRTAAQKKRLRALTAQDVLEERIISKKPQVAAMIRQMGGEGGIRGEDSGRLIKFEKARLKKDIAATAGFTVGPQTGSPFGFGTEQTIGMAGQFAQSRGGFLEKEQFTQALAARRGFGVSAGLSGALARGGVAGGGGTGVGLAQAIGAAVSQKLEGSQIGEYLSTMVDLQESAERNGVKFDGQSFLRQTGQLEAAGLKGLQGQRVAAGLNRAGARVAETGALGPIQEMMRRSTQAYRQGGGDENYAETIADLEGGLTGDTLNTFMKKIVRTSTGPGRGPRMSQLMVKRDLQRMGVPIGMGQAADIINQITTTGKLSGETEKDLRGIGSPEWLASRGKIGGKAAEAARVQGETITAGGSATDLMFKLQRSQLEGVRQISKFTPELTAAVGIMNRTMEKVGSGMRDLINALKGTTKAVNDSAKPLQKHAEKTSAGDPNTSFMQNPNVPAMK